MRHDFQKSAQFGELGCKRIQEHLWNSLGIQSHDVGMTDQFRGIDLDSGATTFEVKTDQIALRTGNAFIETLSNVGTGRRGWALTCQANWLLYFITADADGGTLHWIRPPNIKELVGAWSTQYPMRDALNYGYMTRGVCVPLQVFRKHCDTIEDISPRKSPLMTVGEL